MSNNHYVEELAQELGLDDNNWLQLNWTSLFAVILWTASNNHIDQLNSILHSTELKFTEFIASDTNTFWPKTIRDKKGLVIFLLTNNDKKYSLYKVAMISVISNNFIAFNFWSNPFDFSLEVITDIANYISWQEWESIREFMKRLKSVNIPAVIVEMKKQIINMIVDFLYKSTKIPKIVEQYRDSIRNLNS